MQQSLPGSNRPSGLAQAPLPEALPYLRQVPVHYLILHSEFDPVQYVNLRIALGKRPDVTLLLTERIEAGEVALYQLSP